MIFRMGAAMALVCLSQVAVAAPPSELARLQRAAVRLSGLRGPYEGMGRRLRLSPLLPHLTVSVWRGVQLGRGDVLSLQLADPDRMSFSVTARWDLARILFAKEELAIVEKTRRAQKEERALRLEVVRLYHLRLQALGEEGAEAAGRAAALSSELEALTGMALDDE